MYAKVSGDWTRRLYAMSKDVATLEVGEDVEEREAFLEKMKEYQGEGSRARVDHPGKQVTVISDGPYGGLKMDLAEYDSVLCFAGGSGITFALGTIEEAIRVREAGRRPSRVQVIWAVKEICKYNLVPYIYTSLTITATVEALSSTLSYLHARAKKIRIDLRYDIYLTRQTSSLPDISAILPITTTLSSGRPEISQLVRSTSLSSRPSRDTETGQQDLLEGLAVIACGPEGIIAEAGNAVASLSIKERVKCRGIRFHGECYAL